MINRDMINGDIIICKRSPRIYDFKAIEGDSTKKVANYFGSQSPSVSPTNDNTSSKSTPTQVSKYASPKELNSRGTTPLIDDTRSTKLLIEESEELDGEIETQEDMEKSWMAMDEAKAQAGAGNWKQAHIILSTIQNPFWRDAGHSQCAVLAANVAIDEKTKESADICFTFCDQISHAEQKTLVTNVIEIMLHEEMKTTILGSDDIFLDIKSHPFQQAKAFAAVGYWDGAQKNMSQIQTTSYLRDRGYYMLAKMAADAAIEDQNKTFINTSRGFCNQISDEEKKTQALQYVELVAAGLPDVEKYIPLKIDESFQQSTLVSGELQKQAAHLASQGCWAATFFCISKIASPDTRDSVYRDVAIIAASHPYRKSRVAYSFCREIKNRTLKAQTKTEINRLVGWKQWIPSNPGFCQNVQVV